MRPPAKRRRTPRLCFATDRQFPDHQHIPAPSRKVQLAAGLSAYYRQITGSVGDRVASAPLLVFICPKTKERASVDIVAAGIFFAV
jgi:hypothetical protein